MLWTILGISIHVGPQFLVRRQEWRVVIRRYLYAMGVPQKPIYLDYHATTPVDPKVLEAMIPWFTENFGNPASRSHAKGWQASEAVEISRGHVAR